MTTNETINKAMELLDRLAIQLGKTGTELFTYMVQRTFWDGLINLISVLLILILFPLVSYLLIKKGIKVYNLNPHSDDELIYCIPAMLLIIIAFIIMFTLPTWLLSVVSPEGQTIYSILHIR